MLYDNASCIENKIETYYKHRNSMGKQKARFALIQAGL